MTKIHLKLREARKLMKMSQRELADWMMYNTHSIISAYENEEDKGVSDGYIKWLLHNNFDLNSVFDDNLPLRQLTDTDLQLNEQAASYGNAKLLDELKKKELRIKELEAQLKILKDVILDKGNKNVIQRSA